MGKDEMKKEIERALGYLGKIESYAIHEEIMENNVENKYEVKKILYNIMGSIDR